MARKQCSRCSNAQAVRPGGLCNKCFGESTGNSMTTRPITARQIVDIVVLDRTRKDFGDLDELRASIRTLGMLHPIPITPENKLIVGQRRLMAAQAEGWAEVPVVVIDTLDTANLLLQAERDENTCRKPFTPIELVHVGRRLEEIVTPLKAANKATTQAKPGEGKVGTHEVIPAGAGNLPAPEKTGDSRDKVAAAVGVSGRTYDKAKAVVEAAEESPEEFGDLAKSMDETGFVDPAYQEMKRRLLNEKEVEPVFDNYGVPVPEPIQPAFATAAVLKSANKLIRQAMKEFESIRGKPGTEKLALQTVLNHLENAQKTTSDAIPRNVCPQCDGLTPPKECICQGRGWIAAAGFDSLPLNLKRKAERYQSKRAA